MKLSNVLFAGALCVGFTAGAQASPVNTAPQLAIPGLYNTGVDDLGVALAGGNGVTDSHYDVISSTIGLTVPTDAVTYTHPSYVANSSTSRWISNDANGSPGNGTVTFRLTFDLTGLNPGTASISGLNAVDNAGRILLNGVDTGITMNSNFGALAPFFISSGFIAGINTLDFAVTDFGPPLALRIENLRGSASASPVPVPAAVLLLSPALIALGATRRKTAAT